jgi:histidyl-tRNA synthetase
MDLSLPRGIRDIEPEEFAMHAKLRGAFEDVARVYNFQVMEPASLEHLSTLRAKSGEEVDKEIYTFKDKGGRDVGLRFDLTVGITRFVCSRKDLRLPAKIGAFGGMWRYDEPQFGRYRWYHQWDLEIFGPPSVGSDAEVIDASAAILNKIGLNTLIKVGDRRVVEDYIRKQLRIDESARVADLMRALDKVEKKTRAELVTEYLAKGFKEVQIRQVLDLSEMTGDPDYVLNRAKESHLNATGDLTDLRDMLKARGVRNVQYCLRVVRGIDYYTGIVFEVVDSTNARLGSLCGGGRYDALPGLFGRPDLSATGAAGGIEREAMSIKQQAQPSTVTAFVAFSTPEVYYNAIEALAQVRGAGISSEIVPGKSLSKQLESASALGAEWVIIIGPRELAAHVITLREMATRKEQTLPLDEALKLINKS